MELVVDNISCGYNEHIVVNNLYCSFNQGEATAILGSNGVGKTTLIKAILRQNTLLSGKVRVNGDDVSNLNLKTLAKYIAYVPQTKDCRYNYRVIDVVMMGLSSSLSVFSAPGKVEYERAMEVLQTINMEEYADRNYSCLSGGEQQMVLLARAIVQNSQFILMDEPASNLDYYNQKILLKTIISLKNRNKGIVFITHSPEHAFLCCEKVLMIKSDGSYVFGKTEDVLNCANMTEVYNTKVLVLEQEIDNKLHKACSIDDL